MAQFLNFKRVELVGASKEEAFANAPFSIMGDATQAYKSWVKKQTGMITESNKKQFMLDYLAKKSKNVANVGFSITLENAVADTRERPYRIEDNKNKKGTRKYKTTYQLRDAETGVVVAETNETKAKAKEIAKALYTNREYKGNLVCTYTKQVIDGEPVAFKAFYTPSKNAKQGRWLAFGVTSD